LFSSNLVVARSSASCTRSSVAVGLAKVRQPDGEHDAQIAFRNLLKRPGLTPPGNLDPFTVSQFLPRLNAIHKRNPFRPRRASDSIDTKIPNLLRKKAKKVIFLKRVSKNRILPQQKKDEALWGLAFFLGVCLRRQLAAPSAWSSST
jgi:hypothetical protein